LIMTKKNFLWNLLVLFLLISCKEAQKQKELTMPKTKEVFEPKEDIVNSVAYDKDSVKLEMSFNNTQGLAILKLKGETIELVAQKTGSGIWYTNDHYELRGKGENIELKKDSITIFKSK
jgi:membrane-bound inhibitor of C-type lysozyme